MWRNFTAILYRIHGSTGYSYSFLILKYCQKMLTSKPSTLRRFWAPVYRSVISEILGPRDPAIPQRRHFVPLKPVIIRNPQTRKPANPQTRKPANPQTRKPANPQTRKPANPQTRTRRKLAKMWQDGVVVRYLAPPRINVEKISIIQQMQK